MIHLTKQTPDRWSLAACAIGAGLYFSSASLGQAQIVRDGTLGPGVAIQPTGPNYVIPDSHGARAGTNLFHSFQQFNIQPNESATFTGPPEIQNVISRVTGTGASTIDGLLRSQVGRANVWLLNSQGVILGPNARIDVPAAFYRNTPGTTELRLNDGSIFSAASSQLSVAPPEAFGFLAAATPSPPTPPPAPAAMPTLIVAPPAEPTNEPVIRRRPSDRPVPGIAVRSAQPTDPPAKHRLDEPVPGIAVRPAQLTSPRVDFDRSVPGTEVQSAQPTNEPGIRRRPSDRPVKGQQSRHKQ